VNRYAEAISNLREALSEDPNKSEAYYWLYLAHAESGDSAEAASVLSSLEETVAAGDEDVEAKFWLLKIYSESGDAAGQQRLLVELEAAAEADPEDPDVAFYLARGRYALGDLEGALEALQSAAALDPNHTLAHFWLGQVYFEQQRLDRARQEFDTVLRLDPDNAAAYHNRGVTAYRMGDIEQALADLRAARDRDASDFQTRYQLGAIHLTQALPAVPMSSPDEDGLQKAEEEFEAALTACPSMPEPLIGLGNLHLIRGEPAVALEYLNQAVEQLPDSPEVWFALGQAYASLGRVGDACGALDSFSDLSPPPEWGEQAEEMQTELGCP
jgi:tetratricopeptide (TPR) repeat protein